MRKHLLISLLVLFFAITNTPSYAMSAKKTSSTHKKIDSAKLYSKLNLEDEMDYSIFETAISGYNQVKPERNIVTIIDFNQSSSEERMFIIDLDTEELVMTSHVAHGKNTGKEYATNFSNTPSSKKSSLGFYIASESYMGSKGFSLKMDGLEAGINDNARSRGIVIHAADYTNPDFLASNNGVLGRSWGCPSVPENLNAKIINILKGGSLIYIHADDENYKRRSSFVS